MSLEKIVIDNIKRIRKERHISQEQLAELCGTSTSYIGLMEIYKNVPKLATIEKIAVALNVKPQLLFEPNIKKEDKNYRIETSKRIKQTLMSNFEDLVDEALLVI